MLKGMQYLSVCSGIEAATVAWHPLGWQPVAFSEIEKFPCAVLKHHYPDVPNYGDLTRYAEWPDVGPDVLVGGTPCQAFSVAGLRKGLRDPRGNLTLTFLGVVDRYRPEWVVWENVPGVLSIDGGRAFGAFLGGLAELGYGWAYRVLDAQYFGVPQRRRRVFVVGHLGDWHRAAAVLFERESLSGHPPPRREKGQRTPRAVAPSLSASGRGTARAGESRGQDCLVAEVAPTLGAEYGEKWGLDDQHINSGAGLFVAHALRADGFDASEDGTGRGTPLVAGSVTANSDAHSGFKDERGLVAFDPRQITNKDHRGGVRGDRCHALHESAPAIAFHNRQDPDVSGAVTHPLGAKDNGHEILETKPTGWHITRYADATETDAVKALRALRVAVGEETTAQWGLGILAAFWPQEVLRSAVHGDGVRCTGQPKRGLVNVSLSRSQVGAFWSVRDLWEAGCDGCPPSGWQPPEQLARELGAHLSQLPYAPSPADRFLSDLWLASEGSRVLRQALSAVQEARRPARGETEPTHASAQVRRLTVEECEALQGFPRGYTLIPYRGKPAADGPRYKALGNSMAVPVMAWIGERIQMVSELLHAEAA